MYKKLFTIADAQALVPFMDRLMSRMMLEWQQLQSLKPQIELAAKASEAGGGTPAGAAYVTLLDRLRRLENAANEHGIMIKDLDLGTCDLPSVMGDRVVLLCWRRGEKKIGWWHEVDAGFAGRQRLDDD